VIARSLATVCAGLLLVLLPAAHRGEAANQSLFPRTGVAPLSVRILLAPRSPWTSVVQASFERGVEAYRRGDYAEARAAWRATLAEELDDQGRARVLFDLGNAYWRLGEALPAIVCYAAAVRLDPRHGAAWQNLELARAKANLPPADAGGLGATARRLLTGLRPSERRALLFGALVLWSLVLVLEVRFGGAGLRTALSSATVLLVLAAAPWAYGHAAARPSRAPLWVSASGGAPLRAEPLEERAPVGELAALEEVERLDALPGWVRVERADGLRGWAREEALFSLDGR
jgi:tetratricopeptide (TPR) repeat protein